MTQTETRGGYDIRIQGGWSTLRRKRLINLGEYENEELSIEMPWPMEKIEEGVQTLGRILDRWESARKKEVTRVRRTRYQFENEEDPP